MPEPTAKTGADTDEKPVVKFDDTQKEAINAIVEERLGRERKKHKEELETLQKQIEDAKNKGDKKDDKGGKKDGDDTDLKSEFQRILSDQKEATKTAEKKAGDLEKQLSDLQTINLTLRKDMAFSEAADGLNFISLRTVKKLVSDQVEFDSENNNWIARDDNGKIVLNDAMKPASLKEFLTQYATKNDYLVNGQVKSGTGAAESSKNGNFSAVSSKADLKTDADKVAFIKKHGAAAYAKLPLK